MKKRIFALFFLTLVYASSLYAASSKIESYAELLAAVKSGENVRAIINFDDCKTTSKDINAITSLYGILYRMNFDIFGYNEVTDEKGQKHLAVMHSVSGYAEYANNPVITYAHMRVLDNNQIEIHNALYNIKNGLKILSADFNCHIGSDAKSVQFWSD